jgi:diguanylate cyclase (GGDEF)-like protein
VPLLALLAYLVRFRRFGLGAALRILSVTVVATLAGTAVTLWAMHALYKPVTLASRVLRRYLDTGEIPDLPVGYPDRAGRLMADVQYTIERLDAAMSSLNERATTDALTGIYNRRAAEERLSEDIARAERGGGTLTLALLDLDQLKSVNDEHGHHAGDECLIHFARVLDSNVRKGDWIARWGGDEFLLSTTQAEEDGPSIGRALERTAEALRETPIVLGGEEVTLTLSAGVCRWQPGNSTVDLISRADKAIYKAKASGGNAIVHAE